jgi:hypothetical protein
MGAIAGMARSYRTMAPMGRPNSLITVPQLHEEPVS